MRRIINIILLVGGSLILIFLGFLTYASLTDFQPGESETVGDYELAEPLSDSGSYSILDWNIGYAGLGASMDFFYDGGKKVRETEDNTRRNMYMISTFLVDSDTVDFILLQEVDKAAKRSYFVNELDWLDRQLADFFPYFAPNYMVKFVPVPLKAPMGKVESGIVTFSRPLAQNSVRISFPGNYSWPTKLFMLDRCFLVNRYPVSNGKDFILINTHNSAYDDGSLRKGQMDYLKNYLLQQEALGNYVLVGGDWNQSPAGFTPDFTNQLFDSINVTYIEQNFPNENWQWAYSNKKPTNRRVTTPYDKQTSLTTVIDLYLASPNIDIEEVRTIDLQFENSDHQPVVLTFSFK